MERYVTTHIYGFEFTKHLQLRHFAALNDIKRKTSVTDF
jgi:hypothetical protein